MTGFQPSMEQHLVAKRHTRKRDVFRYALLTVTFFFVVYYFYFWLIVKNSFDDLNWDLFGKLKTWIPWYRVLLGLVCATFAYLFILMLYFVYCVLRGRPLRLHVVHVIITVTILVFCVVFTIGINILWASEWTTVYLSLKIMGPFLHIGAVAIMTSVSWIVSLQYCRMSSCACKLFVMSVYVSLMFQLYVSPLFINSPCVVSPDNLPRKPRTVAHRGASGIVPENTFMSFRYAEKYDAYVFETDVRISFDGVPFLLHDKTFRRTTNVADVFPEMVDMDASLFNISQIKSLNAGSWFLNKNPMWSAGDLSDEERKEVANQTIPTLREAVEVVQLAGKRIMFDLMVPSPRHPYHNKTVQLVIDAIKAANLELKKVWWLQHTANNSRPGGVTLVAEEYHPLSMMRRENMSIVNVQYTELSRQNIDEYRDANISVNVWTVNSMWFFSLYWCMGVHSITSNMCHQIHALHSPVWHLAPDSYRILWLTVDVMSIIIIMTVFIVQIIRMHGISCGSDMPCFDETSKHYKRKSTNSKEKLLYDGSESNSERTNHIPRQTCDIISQPSSYPMSNMNYSSYGPGFHSNSCYPDNKYDME
ncbi:glycerophosphoinositol inositolphosphodiesterase GDPD2-like isoform X2 [Gigantopelta aegis]|uniref:glycerophosphoinositol inositolphosphodiesterase GDPD2-like isoform X2 n=1 Tax=Gigantopelta aegis TaxID=1735272 RepID=UPI001B88BF31|nr:glycerophosphoinositol inositolphosphodiesterase GDPD2-like isoform X2 [Gigantopelta aegis]